MSDPRKGNQNCPILESGRQPNTEPVRDVDDDAHTDGFCRTTSTQEASTQDPAILTSNKTVRIRAL